MEERAGNELFGGLREIRCRERPENTRITGTKAEKMGPGDNGKDKVTGGPRELHGGVRGWNPVLPEVASCP